MFQANQNSSVLTVSPPDSGFTPRREFVPDNHVLSSFALLAIAGSSLVRLSSFPPQVTDDLRRTFERRALLRGTREDARLHLFEFNLEQKPWSSSKSFDSEKLFVDILAVVFQHGFHFVSTIDYGREPDDRVSIAFSRPHATGQSPISTRQPMTIPFAVTFPASTTLRVINPPLNSTPAILQGMRSAWPRGVKAERKLQEGGYEFKLKGYKWFQEDTFSTDSLHQIMSLLNTLDRHGFALLTSISLSGSRSRVKDMWLFKGSPKESTSETASEISNIDLTRTGSGKRQTPPSLDSPASPTSSLSPGHNRTSSLPNYSPQYSTPLASHSRSPSSPEPNFRKTQDAFRSVLQKKSPKHYGEAPSSFRVPSEDDDRIHSSDSNSSDIVDMTGVGTLRQKGVDQPWMRIDVNMEQPALVTPEMQAHNEAKSLENVDNVEGRPKTGDLFYITPASGKDSVENSPEHPSSAHAGYEERTRRSPELIVPVPRDVTDELDSNFDSQRMSNTTIPILSPGAFRDSKFSTTTGQSCEIPIVWTGGGGDEAEKWMPCSLGSPTSNGGPLGDKYSHSSTAEASRFSRSSLVRYGSPFGFPGAWQATPIDEGPEEQMGLHEEETREEESVISDPMPETREVGASRVASPTMATSPAATRKSEVALQDMAPARATQDRHSSGSLNHSPASPGPGGGWVLVNIEKSQKGSRPTSTESSSSRPRSRSEISKPSSPTERTTDQYGGNHPPQQEYSMSPVAKVIAAADAVSSEPVEPSSPPSAGPIRRLFTKSKVKSKRLTADGRVVKVKALEREELEKREMKPQARKLSIRNRLFNNSSSSD